MDSGVLATNPTDVREEHRSHGHTSQEPQLRGQNCGCLPRAASMDIQDSNVTPHVDFSTRATPVASDVTVASPPQTGVPAKPASVKGS